MKQERTEEVVLVSPWEVNGEQHKDASEHNPVTVSVTPRQKEDMLKRGGCREVRKSMGFKSSKRSSSKDEAKEDPEKQEE